MSEDNNFPGISALDLLKKNVTALKALASELNTEGTQARNRAKLGRRTGMTLGVIIMSLGVLPTIFTISQDATWLVGISAFFGLLVSINSYVLDPDERLKKSEDCSTLARNTQIAANDLELNIHSLHKDEAALKELLEKIKTTEKEIDQAAKDAGLKTDPHAVFINHL